MDVWILSSRRNNRKKKREDTDSFSRGNMVERLESINSTLQTGDVLTNDVLS